LCIALLILTQGENTLERNYSPLHEEKLLKENEKNYELNPIGEATMEATKNYYTMLLPMDRTLSAVKYCVYVTLKDNAVILKLNCNLNVVS
jgi:hypothetical protein